MIFLVLLDVVSDVFVRGTDAIIEGSADLPTELSDYLKGAKCPVLNFHNKDEFAEAYVDFYTTKVLGA